VSTSTSTYTYYKTAISSTYGDRGVGASFVQTIVIERNDGAAIVFDHELPTMLTENVLPYLGDRFSTVAGDWGYHARARGYTVSQYPGKSVSVTVQYDTQYVVDPCDGAFRLPSSISYATVIRSTPVFRTGWSVSPPPASDASADIGGTALAGGQVSTSQNVPQVRIKVSFMQDAVVGGISAAASATNYVNKLNSSTFLGVAAGYLLCEGVNIIQNQHEFYTVQFEFLYDVWAHHSQVADLAGDGKISLSSGNPTGVKWKRVARSSTDFNAIYGTNTRLQGITEQGYWLPCPEPEP
jgi:hypothetical protein